VLLISALWDYSIYVINTLMNASSYRVNMVFELSGDPRNGPLKRRMADRRHFEFPNSLVVISHAVINPSDFTTEQQVYDGQ
jgi:hypothetical protein